MDQKITKEYLRWVNQVNEDKDFVKELQDIKGVTLGQVVM